MGVGMDGMVGFVGFGWMEENKKSASPKKNCAYSLQDISCSSTVAVGACNGWSRCREWTQHLVGAQYFAPAHLMRCLIVGCAGMDMPSIRCCAIWGGRLFILFHTSKAHSAIIAPAAWDGIWMDGGMGEDE